MRIRILAAAVVAALTLAAAFGPAQRAGAHFEPATVAPAPGGVLSAAPAEVTLAFNVTIVRATIEVFATDGASMAAGPASAAGSTATVALRPELAPGSYRVMWRAVDEDGDAATGQWVFHVAAPAEGEGVRTFVNGREMTASAAVVVQNGQPLLGPAAVAAVTGKEVQWDAERQFLLITDKPAAHMPHAMYMHPAGTPAPTLKLVAAADKKGGFNLRFETANWRWAPDHVNEEPLPNEGHAHLYVDGVQIARPYGEWFLLAAPAPGVHEVTITLNANDHADYATMSGTVVSSSVRILVRPDGSREVLTP